jgi:hypothetical protein
MLTDHTDRKRVDIPDRAQSFDEVTGGIALPLTFRELVETPAIRIQAIVQIFGLTRIQRHPLPITDEIPTGVCRKALIHSPEKALIANLKSVPYGGIG